MDNLTRKHLLPLFFIGLALASQAQRTGKLPPVQPMKADLLPSREACD
jgi:hypothetical protein